jgi:hypothetical protein
MKKTYILLLSFMLLLLVDEVKAQLKLGDQPTSVQKSVILDLQGSNGRQGVWLPRVSDTSNVTGIDALNPPNGVMIFFEPTQQIYIRTNGYWRQTLPTTGIYTISHSSGTVDGIDIIFATGTAAGSAKDFHISVDAATETITFNLPNAAVDTRGVMSTGTQTFAGSKTFTDTLTARLTPPASTGAANTAPLKLKSGTNLTTPEAGAVEFDGTNYYVTSGSTRYTLAKTLTATGTLDFPSTSNNSTSTLTITVNGAADGDVVSLGVPSSAISVNNTYSAYVSAANTVSVVFHNYSGGNANPGSGTFRVAVIKY